MTKIKLYSILGGIVIVSLLILIALPKLQQKELSNTTESINNVRDEMPSIIKPLGISFFLTKEATDGFKCDKTKLPTPDNASSSLSVVCENNKISPYVGVFWKNIGLQKIDFQKKTINSFLNNRSKKENVKLSWKFNCVENKSAKDVTKMRSVRVDCTTTIDATSTTIYTTFIYSYPIESKTLKANPVLVVSSTVQKNTAKVSDYLYSNLRKTASPKSKNPINKFSLVEKAYAADGGGAGGDEGGEGGGEGGGAGGAGADAAGAESTDGDGGSDGGGGGAGDGFDEYGNPIIPSTPTIGDVTINNSTVSANGSTQYTITHSASNGSDGNSIGAQHAMVNYQGTNAGQYRGYVIWTIDTNLAYWHAGPYNATAIACSGGGYAGVSSGYGPEFINLISCSTSISGNSRSTSFVVTFNPSFTAPSANNTLSGWAENTDGVYVGWTPFNTFSLAAPAVNVNFGPAITDTITTQDRVAPVREKRRIEGGSWFDKFRSKDRVENDDH